VASSWFQQNGVIASRPPAGNASRWAFAQQSDPNVQDLKSIMKIKRIPLAFPLLLIIGVISLTIYACAEQNNDLSCESLLPESSSKDVNTTFRVSAPPHINSFELADMIGLVVDNDSGDVIEVAPDRDMKVFWWKENSWEPVNRRSLVPPTRGQRTPLGAGKFVCLNFKAENWR